MMEQLITFIILACLISCEASNDLNSFIVEDVTKYSNRISEWKAKGELWTADPILITRELFRSDDAERKIVIDFESETADEVTVILTQEGLSDDSVAGEMRVIDFVRVNDTWTIKQIRLGFKCWGGRGHKNYSGHQCS